MIALQKVTIRQAGFQLTDVDLHVPAGQYSILMGPTGCGKTSLLEAICGLRRIQAGRIVLDDRDVTRTPPSVRNIGYVPQDSLLFPTMRVDRQIAFGLEVRKIGFAARHKRVEEIADLLQIRPLLSRYPQGLSGGEKQRVAVARALSFDPQLLCLDEPLSALDDKTRQRFANLLATVHMQEKVTVLHVTHNLAEARELGTMRFRIEDGVIEFVEGEY